MSAPAWVSSDQKVLLDCVPLPNISRISPATRVLFAILVSVFRVVFTCLRARMFSFFRILLARLWQISTVLGSQERVELPAALSLFFRSLLTFLPALSATFRLFAFHVRDASFFPAISAAARPLFSYADTLPAAVRLAIGGSAGLERPMALRCG